MRWPAFRRPIDPVVRPFRAERARDCALIHGASFANAWSEGDILGLAGQRQVFCDIATSSDENRLLGFAMTRLALPEAEILTIAIAPRYRGKGIGRILLRQHIERLRAAGVRELFLEVDEKNAPALKLYRDHGFREVGKRPGYYTLPNGSRATALVMRSDLD